MFTFLLLTPILAAIASDASNTNTAFIQSISKREILAGSSRLYSRQEKPQEKSSISKNDVLKLVGDVLFAKTPAAATTKPKDDQPKKDSKESSDTKPQDSEEQKPKKDTPKPKIAMPEPKKDSSEEPPKTTRPPPSVGDFDPSGCLSAHNEARSKESVPALRWDAGLAASASLWANQLLSTGRFEHSSTNHGENLYKGDNSCRSAVAAWYSEKPSYHGEKIGEGDFHNYGHYTQLIWRSTSAVGCATIQGLTVCHYDPHGNVGGRTLSQS